MEPKLQMRQMRHISSFPYIIHHGKCNTQCRFLSKLVAVKCVPPYEKVPHVGFYLWRKMPIITFKSIFSCFGFMLFWDVQRPSLWRSGLEIAKYIVFLRHMTGLWMKVKGTTSMLPTVTHLCVMWLASCELNTDLFTFGHLNVIFVFVLSLFSVQLVNESASISYIGLQIENLKLCNYFPSSFSALFCYAPLAGGAWIDRCLQMTTIRYWVLNHDYVVARYRCYGKINNRKWHLVRHYLPRNWQE